MADRSALRLALDLGVAATVVACGIAAYVMSRDHVPPMPPEVCAGIAGSPRYDALRADGHVDIVALFGQIERGPLMNDPGTWSYETFEAELVARGFHRRSRDGNADTARYELADHGVMYAVDLVGPASLTRDDRPGIDRALTDALRRYDVVYYNGHEYDGQLASLVAPADGYRVVVLDSCWSTQRYSAHLQGPTVDVVGNTERAVTGSVYSFLAFLDGLRTRATWTALLEPMNVLAAARRTVRAPFSKFTSPERYRHDVACPPPGQ